MELLIFILAGAGLLAMIIGRHIMIRDTGGDPPMLWIVALRIVPFSELVYMVRHFAQAKTGGIISIIGMWMMVPFLGTRLWEAQKHGQDVMQKVIAEARAEAGRNPGADIEAQEANAMLAEKEAKAAQLNTRLEWWHQQLHQKRTTLGTNPAEVAAFNADASAYSAFNAVAREEAAELAALRAKAASAEKTKTAARK
jgi:hypothetical protein